MWCSERGSGRCLENQSLEVSLDDHVLYRSHGNFKEIRIRGVGEMTIDLSRGRSVQGNEFIHKVFAGLLPTGCVSLEVRKSGFSDGAGSNLRLEQIDFIKEEDKCRALKPM